MLGATTNDLTGQMAALRDLGALPADTDLEAVIHDLRLDSRMIDPTTLTGEEMSRRCSGWSRRCSATAPSMPKELMLYVKNMVFLDGAIARARSRPRHPRRDHQHLDALRPAPR